METSQKTQRVIKRKVNIIGLIMLIISNIAIIWSIAYMLYSYQNIQASIDGNQKIITDNDKKMQSDPMTQRLESYGESLQVVNGLYSMKEAHPTWYEFVLDIQRAFPKDVFVKQLSYRPETNNVDFVIFAPNRRELLRAMTLLEDTDQLMNVSFSSIENEKVTLAKNYQKDSFKVKATFNLDDKWLSDRYNFTQELKKQEDSKPKDTPISITQSGWIIGTWATKSWTTNTWAIVPLPPQLKKE